MYWSNIKDVYNGATPFPKELPDQQISRRTTRIEGNTFNLAELNRTSKFTAVLIFKPGANLYVEKFSHTKKLRPDTKRHREQQADKFF